MSTRSSVSSVTSAGLILADRTEGGWLPGGPAGGATGVAVACEPAGVAGGSAVQLHRAEAMMRTTTGRKGRALPTVLRIAVPLPRSIHCEARCSETGRERG